GGNASVLDATGYVVAQREATVSSKVTGRVQALLIEEGQHVKQGDVLARLDDSNARAALRLAQAQLEAARANLAQAQAQAKDARRTLDRTRDLAAKKLVAQSALDTAQANDDALAAQVDAARGNVTVAERNIAVYQQQFDDTVVRAPFTGVITVKNAQQGEMISPLSAGGAGTRTGIGTLVDMDSLEIEVDVNENFINRVVPGQSVIAKLNAYPEWEIPCKVIAVIPTADRSKATVKVRIGIELKDPRILPDMGVRVSFLDKDQGGKPEAPKGVWIPAAAVQAGDSGDAAQGCASAAGAGCAGAAAGVVYVVRDGRAERRAVKLGGPGPEGQQVIAGLAAGEQVIVGDLDKLKDGAKVQVAQ
ncbi:MAG: efflux RND transporter periplasmic adaptor subunit, partial [Stenotrophobium sp.]